MNIAADLAEEVQNLKVAIHGLIAKSGDRIENLHQVRVCARQLRAFCWVLRHDYKTSQIQNLKSIAVHMKQLGAALSYGRELDVSLEWAEKHHLNTKPIQALREQEGKKIRVFLSLFLSRRGPKILSRLETLTDLLAQKSPLLVPKPADHVLRKLLLKCQKSQPKSKKDFHRLRISIRNLVYIFKARREDCPSNIGRFQKQLGQLHDFESFKKLNISIHSLKSLKKKRHRLKKKIHKKYPGVMNSLSKTIRN
ncbi:MAG: CHAD domain-containing protein [Pseudomonadota bacterium]